MSREARIIVGLLLSVLAATFWLAAHDRNVIIYVIVAALALTAAVCVITSVRASDQRNVGLEALATIVGDPDAFIATVASHVARFHSWGADKKGFPPENEDLYREWLWRHADQLSRNENRELLVAAIAAYGEFIRVQTGRIWYKSRLLPGREPVIVKPRRPWTRRRPILEVMEILDVVT